MDIGAKKKQILWILPNYNFYNVQRLNLLNAFFDILVIAGKRNDKLGFKSDNVHSKSPVIYSKKHKDSFGTSFEVIKLIVKNLKNKDFVYLAVEKKNLFLLLILLTYRFFTQSKFELFSYNHLALKSGSSRMAKIDQWLTKFFFRKIDRVVFYTKESCELAVERKLIDNRKAYWANNTIDTTEVKKNYSFALPPTDSISILFIGRLISSKRVGDLLKYFEALQVHIPSLKLDIIGNGPDKEIVEKAILDNTNITWHGAIIEEHLIAPIMKRTSLVFVPGHSGLSINHAFAYGRPYVTLEADKHGPEISYLIHNENGYILRDDFEENISKLLDVLNDSNKLKTLCNNAKTKGDHLSVEKWVEQMKQSLLN